MPERKCPIPLEMIEIYLQIFQPAYSFSNGMQSNHCSIADVLIGLQGCLFTWRRLKVTGDAKDFGNRLIECTLRKFDYEINSTYCAALNELTTH